VRTVTRAIAAVAFVLPLVACSAAPRPARLTSADTCGTCRMTIASTRTAGQIAAPGEEPIFFDDIACLARAIARGARIDDAYVADHRTSEWTPAAAAVYTRIPSLTTPMGSSIIAHASDASRKMDSAAATGAPMQTAEVFNSAGKDTNDR
jgi:copper chaperone NosL